MTIYYLNNQGRLGNLIFQYAAALELTNKNDVVVCFNNNLFNIIEADDRFIRIKLPDVIHEKVKNKMNYILDNIANMGLIGISTPEEFIAIDGSKVETKLIQHLGGKIRSVCELKGFFQHDDWICKHIKIKNKIRSEIEAKIKKLSDTTCKVAVHIRAGDYRNWNVLGKTGVLIDERWYSNAITYIQKRINNPEFIFFTDDINYLSSMNLKVPIKLYSDKYPENEIVAISLCDHAIISPSTFALSGALLGGRDKIIIAPKYWAGFKSKVWHPHTIQSEKITYLEVD